MSGKIAETLSAKLTPEEKDRIGGKPTSNLEAYHLYTQGRTHLAQRTERGIRRAQVYFQRAIDLDESYAPAWAGLAEALVLLKFYSYQIPEECQNTMDILEIARKAIELDSDIAESHASLGILYATQKEGPEAICELEQAIELQPSYAEAHNWLGWMHMILGDPNKGIGPAERAAELDPMAPYVRVYLAKIYLAAGKYEQALREARRAREIQPEFVLTYFMEGISLYHIGRFRQALFALNEAWSNTKSSSVPSRTEVGAALALVYAKLGEEMEVRKLLNKIRQTDDHVAAGLVEAALGQTEEALSNFEIVQEWGYFSTAYLKFFFPVIMEPIREDERYRKILKCIDTSWGLNPS